MKSELLNRCVILAYAFLIGFNIFIVHITYKTNLDNEKLTEKLYTIENTSVPDYEKYRSVKIEYIDNNGETKFCFGLINEETSKHVDEPHSEIYAYDIERINTDNILSIAFTD